MGAEARNARHTLDGLFRQSVFDRLAGYEDVNAAERLALDPAMRAIVGREGLDRAAASSSQMGTEWRRPRPNVKALTDLSGAWIDRVHERKAAPHDHPRHGQFRESDPREQLTQTGTVERLFARFDASLPAAGYLAMAGQIVDATVVEARSPRLIPDERPTVKEGSVPAGWSNAKRAQTPSSMCSRPRSAGLACSSASSELEGKSRLEHFIRTLEGSHNRGPLQSLASCAETAY